MKKLLLLLCLSLPAFGQIINPSDTTSGNASGAFSTLNISGISYLVGGARVGAGNVMASDYPVGTWVFWDPTNLNWLIVPTGGAKEVFLVAALEASGTHATCAGGVHCGWFASIGSQVAAIFDAGNCTKDHWVGNSTTTAGASKDLGTAATTVAVNGTVGHVIQANGTTPCTIVVDNPLPVAPVTAVGGMVATWTLSTVPSTTSAALSSTTFASTKTNTGGGDADTVLAVTVSNSSSTLDCTYNPGLSTSSIGSAVFFDLSLDAAAPGGSGNGTSSRSNSASGSLTFPMGAKTFTSVSSGAHSIYMVYRVSTGTITTNSVDATHIGQTWTIHCVEYH